MNKEIFLQVFNNQSINKLIFNHISNFKKPKNTFYYPYNNPKNYKWKELIETPHVLIEYGYLDLLRQYYKKYNNKIKVCNEYNSSYRLFQIAIRFNRRDVLDFFFNELKIDIQVGHLSSIVSQMIEKNDWDLIDYFIKICPNLKESKYLRIFNRLTFINAPLSGSLDRLKLASAKNTAIIMGDYHTQTAFDKAASVGRVDMIDWLLKNRDKKEIKNHRMYDFATMGGHINVIQYLIENNIEYIFQSDPDMEYPDRYLIDRAVQFNQLETLKYICKNQEKLSNNAFVNLLDLASGSDIEMLDWLQANRSEQFTYQLLQGAVSAGNLDIIQWVHLKRPELFTTCVMDYAASYGYLDMIIWLHENRTEGCTTKAMDNAASRGYLKIVIWLHENRTEGCTTDAIDIAASFGHLDIIKWLHENRTEGASSLCLKKAATGCNLEVMKWLYEHNMGDYMEMINSSTIGSITRNGHFEAFKWIYDNMPPSQTLDNQIPLVALNHIPNHTINQSNLDFYRWFLNFFSLATLKKHKVQTQTKPIYSDILDRAISEKEKPKNCIIN